MTVRSLESHPVKQFPPVHRVSRDKWLSDITVIRNLFRYQIPRMPLHFSSFQTFFFLYLNINIVDWTGSLWTFAAKLKTMKKICFEWKLLIIGINEMKFHAIHIWENVDHKVNFHDRLHEICICEAPRKLLAKLCKVIRFDERCERSSRDKIPLNRRWIISMHF